MLRLMIFVATLSMVALVACGANTSVEAPTKMSASALTEIIQKFDEDAKVEGNGVQFTLNERQLFMVHDSEANRMRIITPIAPAGLAQEEMLTRMLQANYDAVLDARYALGNDIIWATFIHPLSSLTQEDFLSGVAQTVTAAETFGSSYTSGAMVFGGGDSNEIHEDLIKQLQDATKKGKEI